MKVVSAVLGAALAVAFGLIIEIRGYRDGRESGLKEGFANGREYEREMWERKPKPEPRVIEVPKIVLQPNPEKETVYIEIPKIVVIETDKVVTETKVYQIRSGCVGGCRCTETGEERP